jgi:SAM-dependent methyltransferase
MDKGTKSLRAIMERDVDLYRKLDLAVPEQRLLRRLKGSWDTVSMLDVGVGAGRTSFTFAAVAGRYLGIDISPMMVDLARALVAEDDHVSFRVADVCDLSSLDETFDVVLFSFNSIDLLRRAQRHQALSEMRRVLRPGGLLLFSTHSLHALPSYLRLGPIREVPRELSARTLYRYVRAVPRAARLLALGRRLDLEGIEQTGWAYIRDGVHGFDLELYYVSIPEQLRELAEARLDVVEITDSSAQPVDPDAPGQDYQLNFLCQPA